MPFIPSGSSTTTHTSNGHIRMSFGNPAYEAINQQLQADGWEWFSTGESESRFRRGADVTIMVYGNERIEGEGKQRHFTSDVIAVLAPDDVRLWDALRWNERIHPDVGLAYQMLMFMQFLVAAAILYILGFFFLPGFRDHWYWIVAGAPGALVCAIVLVLIGWFIRFRLERFRQIWKARALVKAGLRTGKPKAYYRDLLQKLTHADDHGRAAAAHELLRFVS